MAHVALHRSDLHTVEAKNQTTILRLLSEHRDDLAHERARILNRLHVLLHNPVPKACS